MSILRTANGQQTGALAGQRPLVGSDQGTMGRRSITGLGRQGGRSQRRPHIPLGVFAAQKRLNNPQGWQWEPCDVKITIRDYVSPALRSSEDFANAPRRDPDYGLNMLDMLLAGQPISVGITTRV
jgi:hypothetical protein